MNGEKVQDGFQVLVEVTNSESAEILLHRELIES